MYLGEPLVQNLTAAKDHAALHGEQLPWSTQTWWALKIKGFAEKGGSAGGGMGLQKDKSADG